MTLYQENELRLAAARGDFNIVQALLAQGINVNAIDEQGNTALIYATENNQNDIVRLLCTYEVDVNHTNKKNENALIIAICSAKDKSIVRDFITKGACFDSILFQMAWEGDLEGLKELQDQCHLIDRTGQSVLHYAAAAGHLSVIQWLVVQGIISINQKDKLGYKAIHRASKNGYLELVKWMLEEGGQTLYEITNRGNTPLHLAAINDYTALEKWMIETQNVNPLHTNDHGWGIVHFTALNGNLSMMKWLQEKNISLSQLTNSDFFPFDIAAKHGHLELMQWLFKQTRIKKKQLWTTLDIAISARKLDIVKWLIKEIKMPAANKKYYNSALLAAADSGDLETVQWLLQEGGSKISERSKKKMTPLLFAALRGSLDIMEWLLEHGASLSERDQDNIGVMCYAAQGGHKDMIKWLLKQGEALSDYPHDLSALHHAIHGQNIELVEWLIEKKDMNLFTKSTSNDRVINPLIFATAQQHPEVGQFLLKKGAGIKADFTHIPISYYDPQDIVLIGATMQELPLQYDGAIHNNEELKKALAKHIELDILSLRKAVLYQLAEYPDDAELQETLQILNNAHNAQLLEAINKGIPIDWISIYQKVQKEILKYPDDVGLQKTKRVIECSSLKNRCLFFCSNNLASYPECQETLPEELSHEIERVNKKRPSITLFEPKPEEPMDAEKIRAWKKLATKHCVMQ